MNRLKGDRQVFSKFKHLLECPSLTLMSATERQSDHFAA